MSTFWEFPQHLSSGSLDTFQTALQTPAHKQMSENIISSK